ncbi:MAG TPA: AAA family ATPase [Geobacteraceae bacterium]
MSDELDIAVVLGLVRPSLPRPTTLRELSADPEPEPPQLIQGVLHRGCKLILGGTSKSNKSWCLLDLAISVASGTPWWGRPCAKAQVIYINFELPSWSITSRIAALCAARPEVRDIGDSLVVWNLRGYGADISSLRPELEENIDHRDYGLIIVDPAYKLLGKRDENANGDIASLMNEFEAIASRTGAALAIAHHFAKGDSTAKHAIDRMSGAGVWARDPDSILVMTPHEAENSFTVTGILRNLPQIPDFVLTWDFPLMKLAPHLNPDALRSPQSRQKVCSDSEFIHRFITTKPTTRAALLEEASKVDISRATVDRYLQRLTTAGLISSGGGLYWLPDRGTLTLSPYNIGESESTPPEPQERSLPQ